MTTKQRLSIGARIEYPCGHIHIITGVSLNNVAGPHYRSTCTRPHTACHDEGRAAEIIILPALTAAKGDTP